MVAVIAAVALGLEESIKDAELVKDALEDDDADRDRRAVFDVDCVAEAVTDLE